MPAKTPPDWNELDWREFRLEPSLGEMMSESIILMLMRRDGVTGADVWQLMEAARLRAGHARPHKLHRGEDAA